MDGEKLVSRLDQQSSLICMLKQRNDKSLKEVSWARMYKAKGDYSRMYVDVRGN